MITLEYSISQTAKKMKLTAFTLRYYDIEGLLPNLSRNKAGNRIFTDADLEMLSVICCLKNTGMPIKQIKQFISWQKDGNYTLHKRNEMLLQHQKAIHKQISDLQKNLQLIDHKLNFYKNACEAYDSGTSIPSCCNN